MICEKCGCHDRVMRTIRRQDRVVRIRRCITCGHMVTTQETKIENPTPTKPVSKPPSKQAPEPTPVKSAKPRKRKQKAEPSKKDDSAKGALAQAMAQAR